MRRIAAVCIACLMTACALRGVRIEEPQIDSKADFSGVMRLVGRFSIGHACPCDGTILSAAHIVNPFYYRPVLRDVLVGYAWEDSLGNCGYVISQSESIYRDIGFFKLISGNPHYYECSLEEPKLGEEVHWFEYDDQDFESKERKAHITRIIAGHIEMDRIPNLGASGSCLFNSYGQVIGVISWFRGRVAMPISVWGSWWPENLEKN